MLDRIRKNSSQDSRQDSMTGAAISREENKRQTIPLTPRQKESLEILNDHFEEEYKTKVESLKFPEVS